MRLQKYKNKFNKFKYKLIKIKSSLNRFTKKKKKNLSYKNQIKI